MRTFLAISLFLVSGCNDNQISAMSAAANGENVGVEDLVIDCRNSPMLGTWSRTNTRMNDTWVFYSDCTGEHLGCGFKFTYPNDVNFSGDIFDAQVLNEGLQVNYCQPRTLQPQTGYRSISIVGIDSAHVNINGIWQGSVTYEKR